jgi:hypothetical protein
MIQTRKAIFQTVSQDKQLISIPQFSYKHGPLTVRQRTESARGLPLPLFTNCREGVFSETGLPISGRLGNSRPPGVTSHGPGPAPLRAPPLGPGLSAIEKGPGSSEAPGPRSSSWSIPTLVAGATKPCCGTLGTASREVKVKGIKKVRGSPRLAKECRARPLVDRLLGC